VNERRSRSSRVSTPEEIRRGLVRKRRSKLLPLLIFLVLVIAAGILTLTPVAAVEAVNIQGAEGRSDPRLEAATDLVGDSIVWVDTGRIERRLEEIAWVERATVTKDFIAKTVNVEVVQRSPAGFIRSHGGVLLIDRAGVAFEISQSAPPGSIELSGEIGPGILGSKSEQAATVIYCAESLERWSKDPFSRGAVESGVISLLTSSGAVVRVGDDSDLDEKGRALRAMQERAVAEGWRVRQYNVVAPSAPALERY
jgi:hypothetical protein